MYNELVAKIFGFLAMSFVIVSYFLKSKSGYLTFQLLNVLSLALSYLFCENFFAMIGISSSLIRTFVYFIYEKKGKEAPLVLGFVFSSMAIVAWVIVNVVILSSAQWVDGVFIVACICYAFIVRIRNLRVVRYAMLFPLALSVLYNALVWSTVFAVCSYSFELVADIVSIIKNELQEKKKNA